MSFNELGLSAELLRALSTQGYTEPTPIQSASIPAILNGQDLMACAQTGTGKTAAFVLPMLQRLAAAGQIKRTPRALVLVPTRELALQVEESVRLYGQFSGVRSIAVFGGVGISPQIAAFRRGVDIVVATPGRLLDHMSQRTVDLSSVEIVVLDEADRMLDMGFIPDMRKILARLPAQRQSLLFSATFSDDIRALAGGLLRSPKVVEVARRNAPAEAVDQVIYPVDRERKRELLLHLFSQHGWHQVLIFARTKYGADALAEKLDRAGIRTAALHGNKTQGARQRALNDFKTGKLHALVATDIASRGLDIDALPYVINYELPNVAEDYVHRIGRTGRAGQSGQAMSLVCADELAQLRDIEKLINRNLPHVQVPGFEPTNRGPSAAAKKPRSKPSGAPRGGRNTGAQSPAAAGHRRGESAASRHHSGGRHR
jgi:ATP-dependent RNA helicase RhlE